MKVKIAIIKRNNCTFNALTFDDIKSDKFETHLNEYIDITEIDIIDEKQLLNRIVEKIGYQQNNPYKSYKCFESNEKMLFHVYLGIENGGDNTLGQFLSEFHEPVICNSVMLRYDNVKLCDISFNDIVTAFRMRLIHKAIIIKTDDQIENIEYHDIPIENTNLTENSCRCIQIDFMNKVLCLFVEPTPSGNEINKHASILYKRLKIHGDIVVSMMTKFPSTELDDIDDVTIRKIICICSNMSLSDIEKYFDSSVQGNFYDVINVISSKYENQICENIPDDILKMPTLNSTLHF
jgi:hypothetical protein